MDRITRKELKSDRFALEVEHTFSFFGHHRAEIIRYGAIALAVLLAVAGYMWYARGQHAEREAALSQALQVKQAPVGDANPGAVISFPTEAAKQAEATKRFTEVASKYAGSTEGYVAQYYLAAIAAEQGRMADAEKSFKAVADGANAGIASLAKLALSQVYIGGGRSADGEKLLQGLIDSPTAFVSKEQATLAMARSLMTSKPADARKLIEPLRTIPGQVGQAAITLYGEIPAQ